MTVEHRDGSNGQRYTVTTECPYCNEAIDPQLGLAVHIRAHCTEVPG